MNKENFIKRLWELTGEVGDAAENNPNNQELTELYSILSDALDKCESEGLNE